MAIFNPELISKDMSPTERSRAQRNTEQAHEGLVRRHFYQERSRDPESVFSATISRCEEIPHA